ncbi:LuxR C-terminal-related transcriptional regulator [Streptomyces sp. CC224B]|uniref:helix-turn-helix transcriptional regulator n=1 Tax=Streptomyces sp. CC224B TaxID=3044571 RepID=UPI0024A9CBF3|nr:LuxR C-terminal-related transcriptional regulator [Streptomyces sp. CC224B]
MMREHVPHSRDELCEAGQEAYARALEHGRIHENEAVRNPCLSDLGLIQHDERDRGWARPVAPSVVLPQLLYRLETDIAEQRALAARLGAAFQPLTAHRMPRCSQPSHGITVLEGMQSIDEAIDRATADTYEELLVIQPGGKRKANMLQQAVGRAQLILGRGGRMRTLYQETTRYSLAAVGHYAQLEGDVEVRTLDELPQRLFLFDRTVAFIPASKTRLDAALELRNPALITHLVATFKLLWQLATPMWPESVPQRSRNGVTPRQQAIAALLTEGLTDTEIATRLGMNVRTARVHIAKLSALLQSSSRTQLGYLIGRSGILDQRR